MATVAGVGQGSLTPRPRTPRAVTFAPMLKKEDGMIDWARPAQEIERRIGLHTLALGVQLLAGQARQGAWREARGGGPGAGDGDAGTVVRAGADGIRVATGVGALLLTELQLEGRSVCRPKPFSVAPGFERG